MPRVTALRALDADTTRLVLEVDGAPFATVSDALALRLGLRAGLELAPTALDAVRDDADGVRAMDQALGRLDRRPYSVAALRTRLVADGIAPARADAVLGRLQALRILDDAEYARALVRAKTGSPGWGRARLQEHLRAHGLDDATIAPVLEEVFPGEGDEVAAAERVARKRVATLRGLGPAATLRRLAGFLARRGYDEEIVARVCANVLGRHPDDLDPNADPDEGAADDAAGDVVDDVVDDAVDGPSTRRARGGMVRRRAAPADGADWDDQTP